MLAKITIFCLFTKLSWQQCAT